MRKGTWKEDFYRVFHVLHTPLYIHIICSRCSYKCQGLEADNRFIEQLSHLQRTQPNKSEEYNLQPLQLQKHEKCFQAFFKQHTNYLQMCIPPLPLKYKYKVRKHSSQSFLLDLIAVILSILIYVLYHYDNIWYT